MRQYRRMGFRACLVILAFMILQGATLAEAFWHPIGEIPIGTLPPLHVQGNRIVDPTNTPVTLRGIAIPDVEYVQRYRRGGVPALIDHLTSDKAPWYPRVLRIPVYPEPDGVLPIEGWISDPTHYFTEYLDPAVRHCISKQIYCIIDWHWVSSYAQNTDPAYGIDAEEEARIFNETTNFWLTMVEHYKNVPNVLFELFNEPIYPDDWATWHAKAQQWITIIRRTGAENIILVGAPHWSLHTIDATKQPFDGGNIVYTAHVYPGHTKPNANAIIPIEDRPSFFAQQNAQWDKWFGTASGQYPIMVTEFGWEACENLRKGKCENHPSGGTATYFGNQFKPYLEEPTYPMPPRAPKVVGWTVWVADYCLGPRLFEQDRTLPILDTHQGSAIKQWLYEYRNDYFPTPTDNLEPVPPLTTDPEEDPTDACDYDE